MNEEFKLCYVERQWAYFTTQPLDQQWGDDWNDAPYEHNAGDPYYFSEHDKSKGREEWRIIMVAYRADLETPAEAAWGGNSNYSVEQINRGDVAWLRPTGDKGKPIYAGCTLIEFVDLIKQAGGMVFQSEEMK